MNYLEEYFNNNTGPMIWKWKHYFDIYDKYFSSYRGKDVVLLEIGVFQGGSLQMWRDYFGEKARIYGVDINPECKVLENGNIKIFIGDQSDPIFLAEVKKSIPPIDILIDDGSHNVSHQIASFEFLYSHIKENGIYLCEDLHTSYWKEFGGGFNNKNNFIEFSKRLIDSLHAWHTKEKIFKPDIFTSTAYALHYYDSVFVIEKQPVGQPISLRSGIKQTNADFPEDISQYSKDEVQNSIQDSMKFLFHKVLNIGSRVIRKIKK